MIIKRGSAKVETGDASHEFGAYASQRISDAGGLTQFGAYVETLQPGSRSSERHWHEQEDEFLYLLSGEATVIESDGAHTLKPGDAACWPAGADNAHHVVNESNAPCSYLIVGTRPSHDTCHYPDAQRKLHTEGDTWRIVSDDGNWLKGGKMERTS